MLARRRPRRIAAADARRPRSSTATAAWARRRSAWVRSFACDDMRVLIVCRGPIRKEAIDVFREMGMTQHRHAALGEGQHRLPARARRRSCASWIREHVHPVPDYTRRHQGGARRSASRRSSDICREHGYDSVFAGYGFMAEDADFVRALEEAGLALHRARARTRRRPPARRTRPSARRSRTRCRSRRASTTRRCARCCASTPIAPRSRRSRSAARARGVRRSADDAPALPALAEQRARGRVSRSASTSSPIDELGRDDPARGRATARGEARDGASA